MQIFAGSPAQAALTALALLAVLAEPGDRPDSSALSTEWQPVDDRIGVLSSGAACQFDVRAKNTLSHDVWILFTEASVYSDRINLHRTDLGDEQDKRLTPGEEHTERVEAPGSCGAPRTWFFFVRVGPRGADRVQIRRRTEGERHRTIDLGDSSCWAIAPRTTDNDEADRFVPPATDAIGCEPPGSTRAGLEAGEEATTGTGSDADTPVSELALDGDWVRRDSNNPRNNGMRISVRGDRATLTAMPPTGSRRFQAGQVLWRDLTGDGTVEVRGSDGGYYPARLNLDGPDRLHIDVDHNGPGNDQTWVRAGPSIDGDWVLVDASDGRNESLRVAVQGDRAAVAYVPATAERGIRTGTVLWREIGAGDERHLGRLESLADGRTYESARFRLLDEDRLRVVFDVGGDVQLWTRPEVAEELAAAGGDGAAPPDTAADSAADLAPVARILRDPFLEALVAALRSPKRSAIEAALSDCDAALSAEDVGALEACITEARAETASADLPEDRALIGSIDLFLVHIESLLPS